MFLVNIPFMFAAVWKVLQIFVDDRVKAKIRFLRKADFHILHEFVDRDILPESLGGKVKGKVLSDKQGKHSYTTLSVVVPIVVQAAYKSDHANHLIPASSAVNHKVICYQFTASLQCTR